jgi:hypothetical protein
MRWREAMLLCAFALGLKPGPVLDRVAGAVDEALAIVVVDEPAREQ